MAIGTSQKFITLVRLGYAARGVTCCSIDVRAILFGRLAA